MRLTDRFYPYISVLAHITHLFNSADIFDTNSLRNTSFLDVYPLNPQVICFVSSNSDCRTSKFANACYH